MRRGFIGKRNRSNKARRVGFFGILGAGNIGNDASFESVLGYLRNAHHDIFIDAICAGPERVRAAYGIDVSPLNYRLPTPRQRPSLLIRGLRVGIETAMTGLRLTSWVRRHDVVIVPGMGVLEATLPIRPWSTPWQMFTLSIAGRVFRTKVAFVCVGANPIRQRMTRLLYAHAAKLAFYRSYRDDFSRDVMRQQGIDVTVDHVYPDLAFSIPPVNDELGDPRTIGIGVMAFYGNNDDRSRAEAINNTYREKMQLLVRRLVESDRRVRLFIGDNNARDKDVVNGIVEDIRSWRPDLEPDRVIAEPTESFADLMAAMAPCGAVVAARFHNVISALILAKPTIATGYSNKHTALMTDMGMEAYCLEIRNLDVDQIIKQLAEIEASSAEIRQMLKEKNKARVRALQEQFAELSALLLLAPDAHGTASTDFPQ